MSPGCAAVPLHVPGQVGGASGMIHYTDGEEAWHEKRCRVCRHQQPLAACWSPLWPLHPHSPQSQGTEVGTGTPWLQDSVTGQSGAGRGSKGRQAWGALPCARVGQGAGRAPQG